MKYPTVLVDASTMTEYRLIPLVPVIQTTLVQC